MKTISWTVVYTFVLSQLLVLTAVILRSILIWFGSWIRFDTVTSEVTFITFSIFYMILFQYAIVPSFALKDARQSSLL